MALDSAPVIGSMKSIEELRTGVDINGNEVSRTQAVLGMGLGVFGLKGAGKGIGKGLSQISDKADDIADTAKAASKASSRVVGGAHESLVQYRIRDSLTPLAGTRQTGINRAWKLEQELVQKTGKGTHNWSPAQAKELLETGSVKGFTGHHINNVDQFPDWAGDPRNIRFLGTKPRGGEHLQSLQGHRGNFQNPTSGRLIDRVEMLRQLGFGG